MAHEQAEFKRHTDPKSCDVETYGIPLLIDDTARTEAVLEISQRQNNSQTVSARCPVLVEG